MIMLRQATMNDAKLLLEWRNDPDVLAMVSDPRPLDEERHLRWLTSMLTMQGAWLFIAEAEGVPVGQGRIERSWKALSPKMDAVNIGYSIAKEHRGKGYGKQLVANLVERAHMLGFSTVSARIKRGNLRSIVVAMQAGVNGIELFGEK
jgi:RimJ/RimL family protein N-acetyltransferase